MEDIKELNIVSGEEDLIDRFEAAVVESFPIIELPLKHTFTPNLYTREIFMPAGSLITSMIHKTEHPFFILQGRVSVWDNQDGEVLLEAPYSGVTKAGTRRALFIHEDCVWITCHVDLEDSRDVDKIEARIIEHHDNPLLSSEIKEKLAHIHRYGLEQKILDNEK